MPILAAARLRIRWLLGLVAIAAALAAWAGVQHHFSSVTTIADPVPVETSGVRPGVSTPVQSDSPQTELDQTTHPLGQSLRSAYEAQQALQEIQGYTAIFSKRERIKQKLVTSTMDLKVRREPFSVHLKYTAPKAVAGREVVYVQGLNNDNLIVREVGLASLAGAQPLLPTGSLAMAENRYPVTMIGLEKMLQIVIAQWEVERKYDDVKVRIEGDVTLPTGEVCTVYESLIPTLRDGVQFHVTRLWIDQKTRLAIRVEQFGFPNADGEEPPLIEEYTYSRVTVQAELNNKDFEISGKK